MCFKKISTSWQIRKIARLPNTFLTLLLLEALIFNPLYSCKDKHREVIEVCFTPDGRCIQLIEKAIAAAKHEILVQAYYFTSKRIADALITAHTSGVIIKVLVDGSQINQGSQLKRLLQAGIAIFQDRVPGRAHNKVMIIDDKLVLTGSYNWTHSAEYSNSENLILIYSKHTNLAYKKTACSDLNKHVLFI